MRVIFLMSVLALTLTFVVMHSPPTLTGPRSITPWEKPLPSRAKSIDMEFPAATCR